MIDYDFSEVTTWIVVSDARFTKVRLSVSLPGSVDTTTPSTNETSKQATWSFVVLPTLLFLTESLRKSLEKDVHLQAAHTSVSVESWRLLIYESKPVVMSDRRRATSMIVSITWSMSLTRFPTFTSLLWTNENDACFIFTFHLNVIYESSSAIHMIVGISSSICVLSVFVMS